MEKICTKCILSKDLSCFSLSKEGKYGRNSVCRDCRRIIDREWRNSEKGKEVKKKARAQVREIPATKVCRDCGIEKTNDLFHRDATIRDGLSGNCKDCRNKKNRTRASLPENREKKKEREAQYRSDPQVHKRITEYSRNRQSVTNSWSKIRRVSNPQYRMAGNLRTRFNQAMRNNSKTGSAVQDLGCSIEELRKHIESKFQPGMNWKNYGNGEGKWNIDHIMPLSVFNLTDRQHVVLACHYLNLQPLWWNLNTSKGNKIPQEVLI